MSISVEFTVITDGSEAKGTIRLVDAVAIERRFHCSVADTQTWPLDWAMYGAWHALKRVTQTEEEYDAWLAQVDDFSVSEAEVPKVGAEVRLHGL